jgi:hypothetical protein
MNEYVKAVATRLKPPAHDADPKVVMTWRWFVALTTGVTAMALSVHIALACGLLAGVTGYPGFARATDVETLKAEARVQRIRELSKDLLDTKQKQCVASGDVKRLYLQTYNELRAEYFGLTRREFPDPNCDNF